MSALVIYFEIGQISNDGVIWDNKINPAKIYYNQFDKMFAEWRIYSRFFKGAYEKEKRQAERGSNKLDW